MLIVKWNGRAINAEAYRSVMNSERSKIRHSPLLGEAAFRMSTDTTFKVYNTYVVQYKHTTACTTPKSWISPKFKVQSRLTSQCRSVFNARIEG